MAVNADQVCRLCLCQEDHESGFVLNSIQAYLPFLDSFAGLSQDTVMPQKICSNCEFQIESTQLLRKKAQYTESLWIKHKMFQPSAGNDLCISCHMCNQSLECHELINHIRNVHGDHHFSDCNLCASIRGGIPVTGDPQPVVISERTEPMANDTEGECADDNTMTEVAFAEEEVIEEEEVFDSTDYENQSDNPENIHQTLTEISTVSEIKIESENESYVDVVDSSVQSNHYTYWENDVKSLETENGIQGKSKGVFVKNQVKELLDKKSNKHVGILSTVTRKRPAQNDNPRKGRKRIKPEGEPTPNNAPIWMLIERIVTLNGPERKIIYKCKVCRKGALRPDSMTSHVRNNHKDELLNYVEVPKEVFLSER